MKISNFSFISKPISSIQQRVSPEILNGIAMGTGLGTVAGIGGGSILNMYNKSKNTPFKEALAQQQLGQQFNTDMQNMLDNPSDSQLKQQFQDTSNRFLSEDQRLMNQYGNQWQGQTLAGASIIGGGITGGLLAKRKLV